MLTEFDSSVILVFKKMFVAGRVATRKFWIALSDEEKQGNAAMSGNFFQNRSKAMQLPCFFEFLDVSFNKPPKFSMAAIFKLPGNCHADVAKTMEILCFFFICHENAMVNATFAM